MDFISDRFPEVLAAAQNHAAWPAAMANAELPEKPEVARLHKSAFAIPEAREYPVHTPAATFFGTLHYRGRGGQDAAVLGRLKAAAEAFGLATMLQPYETFFEAAAKPTTIKAAAAEEVEKYAFSFEQGGVMMNLYPIRLHDDVIASAQAALNDFEAGTLPLPAFAKAARALYDAAELFSVELPSKVASLGGRRLFSGEIAHGAVPPQADEPTRALYGEILKAASARGLGDEDRDKLAFAWNSLDKATATERSQTPYEILWNGPTEKQVKAAAEHFVAFSKTASAVLVPFAAFNGISEPRVRAALLASDADAFLQLSKSASARDANVLLDTFEAGVQTRLLSALRDLAA